MVKTIKQTVTVDGNPEEVYAVLMDSKKHSELTGDRATIENKANGKFSTFSGYSFGKNIELDPGKKIVQTWGSQDLPKGHMTEITFILKKQGSRTKLEFTQKNVPDESYEDLSLGWKDFYWSRSRTCSRNEHMIFQIRKSIVFFNLIEEASREATRFLPLEDKDR